MQVLGSAANATQEPSNPWASCNNCAVHVPLKRCFKAAASPSCRGTGKGFLDSHWTISEAITALDVKEPLREREQLRHGFVD